MKNTIAQTRLLDFWAPYIIKVDHFNKGGSCKVLMAFERKLHDVIKYDAHITIWDELNYYASPVFRED